MLKAFAYKAKECISQNGDVHLQAIIFFKGNISLWHLIKGKSKTSINVMMGDFSAMMSVNDLALNVPTSELSYLHKF